MRAARRVVVVADHTKLGRAAFALICRTSEVDELITDEAAEPEPVEALRAAGVEVHLV